MPQLQNRKESYSKKYNIVEEKTFELPEKQKKIDDAWRELLAAQPEDIDPKELKAKTKVFFRAIEAHSVVKDRIEQLDGIRSRVLDYISTQSYTIKNTDGSFEVRQFESTDYGFDTENLAVDNAIATAFAEAAILGDNRERGGFILTGGDGKYRATNLLGAEGNNKWLNYKNSKGEKLYKDLGLTRPFVPLNRFSGPAKNAVAQWHIHPKGNPKDADFSGSVASGDGDLANFVEYDKKRITPSNLPRLNYYLGGNDYSKDRYYHNNATGKFINDKGYPGYFRK